MDNIVKLQRKRAEKDVIEWCLEVIDSYRSDPNYTPDSDAQELIDIMKKHTVPPRPLTRKEKIKQEMKVLIHDAVQESNTAAYVLTRSDMRMIKTCHRHMDYLWSKVKNADPEKPETNV